MAAKKPKNRAHIEPKAKPKPRDHQEEHGAIDAQTASHADTSTDPITIDPPATSQAWTPRVRHLSPDEAQNVISNQISQFHKKPDGTYVREYTTFDPQPNHSLKIFVDAGMNLDEITFIKHNSKGDLKGTLREAIDRSIKGELIITLTEEQFGQLKGFYEAIAYPPKKPTEIAPQPSKAR